MTTELASSIVLGCFLFLVVGTLISLVWRWPIRVPRFLLLVKIPLVVLFTFALWSLSMDLRKEAVRESRCQTWIESYEKDNGVELVSLKPREGEGCVVMFPDRTLRLIDLEEGASLEIK